MNEEKNTDANRALDETLRTGLTETPAPPGLRGRILAALDEEDGRRSGVVVQGRFRFLRHPALLSALAASFLTFLILPPIQQFIGITPAGIGAVRHVHLEGRVVCYDCALAGLDLEHQVACRAHSHQSGIQTGDGRLLRFALNRSIEGALLEPGLRGRQITVEGDLYPAIGYLDITSYSTL